MMTNIEELQQAIMNLPRADYARLKRWIDENDWEQWDKQIEADSDEGRLDFLLDEAADAKRRGTLEHL